MLRNLLTRPKAWRLISLTCLLSLCGNLFFVFSKHHARNVTYNQRKQGDPGDGHGRSLQQLSGGNLSLEELTTHSRPAMSCTLCPYYPPGLLGPLADMDKEISPEDLKMMFKEMSNGRMWPSDCVAREKIAVVIPYRNRYHHLHIFLHNLIPFLERQQADATIIVIEQALPGTFNRGALLNVGFMEANKIASFDCFIFHDVDLIPLDDRHLYRCGDNPKHLAVAMNKYNFVLPYRDYFGGAVAFSRRQYQDINGCSNVYFGWGGEDDEMLQRVLNSGYSVARAPVHIARYDMIKHNRDKGNEDNPFRAMMLSSARERQKLEGLNTLKYKVHDIKVDQLYTWITVTFNQTELIKSAPSYVWQALVNMNENVVAPPNINTTTTSTTTTTTTTTTSSTTASKPRDAVKTNVKEPKINSAVAADVTS